MLIESKMIKMIKQFIKRAITKTVVWLSKTSAGLYAYQQIIDTAMNRERVVNYRSYRMVFAVPNWLCQYRIDTFATKEPETLEWIDTIPEGSVLWDVGTNIGLYTIYAAKARNCQVYAFEPSVFNLEVLARNIHLNNLSSLVTIVPMALNDKTGVGELNMTSEDWGGALSSFDKSYGFDGQELDVIFKYSLFSITMDEVLSKLNMKAPDYVKIDVDGIEHLILQGGTKVLSSVKGVLIELPGVWAYQTDECEKFLSAAGLTKIVNNEWHSITNPTGSPNQIWIRK